MDYEPYNHYWQKDDGSLFSAARGIYVTEDDLYYQAWLEMGGVPTPYPKDDAGNYDERRMYFLLYPLGMVPRNPEMHEEAEGAAE